MQFQTAQKCLKVIQKLPCYHHMVLQPFNMQEVRQYMCIGMDRDTVSDQTAAAIHARTGGLPLYVEQVCMMESCAISLLLGTPDTAVLWLYQCSCNVACAV